jgi:EF-P beta-lysylation protein EpmB
MKLATDLMSQIVTRESDCVEGQLEGETSWPVAMKLAYRQLSDLLAAIGLDKRSVNGIGDDQAPTDFPLFVPREWARRIRSNDPQDPLLRQVLIHSAELMDVPGFGTDPVGDLASQTKPGLLHKYQGRALLVTTGACAIHCRYCFRRHFPYHEAPKSLDAWNESFDTLQSDTSIQEVLLSGGDPLTLVDSRLAELIERLEEIPHLQRLRIHSRMPTVIPQRVTDSLCQLLRSTRLSVWFVLHVNHAQELDGPTCQAIRKLRQTGAVVLNQAVLLRGVNDSVHSLEELCLRLVNEQVIPYYLHQLDRVAGAAHFEVPVAEGLALIDQLRQRLPGYAVPRYVQEIAGQASKTSLEQLYG